MSSIGGEPRNENYVPPAKNPGFIAGGFWLGRDSFHGVCVSVSGETNFPYSLFLQQLGEKNSFRALLSPAKRIRIDCSVILNQAKRRIHRKSHFFVSGSRQF